MPSFDAYIFIDWSASGVLGPIRPAVNNVWIGELTRNPQTNDQTYHRSRNSAILHIRTRLQDHVTNQRRVLIGFDFAYGYPHGLAASLGWVEGAKWAYVWNMIAEQIEDNANNANNRFAAAEHLNRLVTSNNPGPFWGHPANRQFNDLNPTSPGFPYALNNANSLPRLRLVEEQLTGVQETWKLFGAGSVGSQALVGIPYLRQLRNDPDFVQVSRVWPFDTGFELNVPQKGPYILHAEIWPGTVNNVVQQQMDANANLIKDQVQVEAMCNWASALDDQNLLCRYFGFPNRLDTALRQQCQDEEGWILGAV